MSTHPEVYPKKHLKNTMISVIIDEMIPPVHVSNPAVQRKNATPSEQKRRRTVGTSKTARNYFFDGERKHHHQHRRQYCGSMCRTITSIFMVCAGIRFFMSCWGTEDHLDGFPPRIPWYKIVWTIPAAIMSSKEETKSQQQQSDDAYVSLFYVLLFINVWAALPWFVKKNSRNGTKTCDLYAMDGLSEHFHQELTLQQPMMQNSPNNLEQEHYDRTSTEDQKRQRHHNLLYRTYLPPYLLAVSADWLQGPYKYALYSSYGYTQRDIAHLFVAGYGSGMVLGSIAGGLADVHGRKRLCLYYCIAYAVSVCCTHFSNYTVLLIGRVGGGIGTSLLFSVFESWLIGAHVERGLAGEQEDEKWLADSFAVGMYGSSFVAILSGVLANFIVGRSGKMRPLDLFHGIFGMSSDSDDPRDNKSNFYYGGYVAAFDACIPILVCCGAMIMLMWDENYGEKTSDKNVLVTLSSRGKNDSSRNRRLEVDITPRNQDYGFAKKHSSMIHPDDEVEYQTNGNSRKRHNLLNKNDGMFVTLRNGMHTVWQSPQILMCCIIGSFFEGAMYIFIFLWTPALTSIQRTIRLQSNSNDGRNVILPGIEGSHGDMDELPFGWIFSSFMVCCMLGTITFSHLSDSGVSASKCLVFILGLSAVSSVAMAVPFTEQSNNGSGAYTIQYIGMLLYEFCIGAYYPAMGTVKGTIVPEDQRAAIYNIFRLPLNLFVLLYLVGDFNTGESFLANAVLLLLACILQAKIVKG